MTIPCQHRRPKSAAATSETILEAARLRFLQESYESVGLRDIAADAGVDVALVSRYFGSKEELFRRVLGVGGKEDLLPAGVSDAEIAAFMARLHLEQGGLDGTEHLEKLLIILRSASSPTASQLVREALESDILRPFAERLRGPDPEVRGCMAMAVWMGVTIMRTIMSVEPMCERSGEIEARLRRLFEAALVDQ